MPFFEGIQEVVITNTSCQGCNDGHLNVIHDPSANCNRCEFGTIKIYNEDQIDVTTLNNNEELNSGTYYVTAVDTSNNCWVGFREVIIE